MPRLSVNRLSDSRFLRFLAVGALNALFGYACYAFFIFLTLAPWLALLLATFVGVGFNFFTIGRFVFRQRHPALLWRFAGVYLFTYLLNAGLLKLAIPLMGDPYLAQLLLVLPMAILTYLLMRRFVFESGPSHA